MDEYMGQLATFGYIAGLYVTVAVFTDFFIKHYVFRWRTAMNDYYATSWHAVRGIEGASQRVQEDTMRFARLMEGLGVSFMRSVMTLFAFLPILWTLSEKITALPWIGPVSHSLVWVAIVFALAGTVLMAVVGVKLPGLEFENQRVEAAFRKELVYGEDNGERATPARFSALFADVRRNYFRLFFHYMYFDVARYAYLQFGVLVPYIAPRTYSGCRRHHSRCHAADRSRLRQGGKLVPISCEQLDHDCRTDLRIQTAPCLRAPHRRRRGECAPQGSSAN
jgi:peptide/bleomycin uptake transporter